MGGPGSAYTYSRDNVTGQCHVCNLPFADECDFVEKESTATNALCCDKCDGPHQTDKCPHFKKARTKHADGWVFFKSKSNRSGDSADSDLMIRHYRTGDSAPRMKRDSVQVVPQPGDGSCLFHSLSYGLADRSNAYSLRAEICDYIKKNPGLSIADTSIKDWIKFECNESVQTYAKRMKRGSWDSDCWGGGIEMAALMCMKKVNVHVYEKRGEEYKRITAFEINGAQKTVSVLYQGRNHYDAIVFPSDSDTPA